MFFSCTKSTHSESVLKDVVGRTDTPEIPDRPVYGTDTADVDTEDEKKNMNRYKISRY